MTRRMLILTVAGVTALTFAVNAQVRQRPEVLLQAAIRQELVDGDLKGAIEQFKTLAVDSNPTVAAAALVHLAAGYDKLGDAQARSTYERVILQYPSQTAAVAEARAWLATHPDTASQRGRLEEQIWTGNGVNLEGEPSADGRSLVFVDWTSRANLAVRDLRTGRNRVLTNDATSLEFAENPIWSPDGQRVAYRFCGTDAVIRLINADGSRMRVLTHDSHRNYLVDWSPDDRFLAAEHANGDQTRSVVLISTVDGAMTQLKSLGTTGASLGGYSPDGRYLVYAMNKNPDDPTTGNGGVFLLAVDGSGEVPLVEGSAVAAPTEFSAPVWSPDGQRVVFISDRSEERSLWAIGVRNGRPHGSPELLQPKIADVRPLGFTRDGAFYYGTRQTLLEAYVADLNPDTLTAGKPVPVTDRSVGNNFEPELSPDGKYVAFMRRSAAGPPHELVIRSLQTGEERTLTRLSTAYGARTLQWFPDSRSLLVNDLVNRRKRFRQIDIASGDAKVVFDGPWGVWTSALSADGAVLFYSLKDGARQPPQLMKRQLATGLETEIYRTDFPTPGVGLFGLTASPDGKLLAFAPNTLPDGGQPQQRLLMIMPTSGGKPRELLRSSRLFATNAMSWTKDSRHLILTASTPRAADDEREQQIYALPVDGGELKPLGLSMERTASRMVSADGQRIAFTAETRKQELWVIRNLLSEPAAR